MDATDRLRVDDCREELHGLLQEEVCLFFLLLLPFFSFLPVALSIYLSIYPSHPSIPLAQTRPLPYIPYPQRQNLANLGATAAVRRKPPGLREQDGRRGVHGLGGDPDRSRPRGHQDAPLARAPVQRHDGRESSRGPRLGC